MSSNYVRILFGCFMVNISSTLICYDSSAALPSDTSECGKDMMCYSEYYAVNRSGTIRQYFDRFCVHRKHCADRGIDPTCQTLEQLDKGIQKTFFKYHHAKPSRKSLIQSRFCCCETDRCNNFDSQMAFDTFGITSTSQHLPLIFDIVIASLFCVLL